MGPRWARRPRLPPRTLTRARVLAQLDDVRSLQSTLQRTRDTIGLIFNGAALVAVVLCIFR